MLVALRVIQFNRSIVIDCSLKSSSGTKSEVLDVDKPNMKKYPLFIKARRYECQLDAGDVLFIPGKKTNNKFSCFF